MDLPLARPFDHPALDAPLPQWFNLEVTAHCNLKCPFCATGNGEIPMHRRGFLSEADFQTIFAKIRPHADTIQLFNWGEPFMHKGLLGFIETISASGIKTQISSNLAVRLFDQPELERIVRSGLTSLLASIDGIWKKTYGAYRINGNLRMALANLQNLRLTRDRLGSETPHLIWGYYVNQHNEGDIAGARRKAEAIGVPIWFKELSCPPEFQTRLLAERPWLFDTPPDMARYWQARNNRGLADFTLDPRLPRICNVCRMPFELMVINYNGDVLPCTAMTTPDVVVGNLLTESLEDIWHRKMRLNRRQLLDVSRRDPSSQCGRCRHFPA